MYNQRGLEHWNQWGSLIQRLLWVGERYLVVHWTLKRKYTEPKKPDGDQDLIWIILLGEYFCKISSTLDKLFESCNETKYFFVKFCYGGFEGLKLDIPFESFGETRIQNKLKEKSSRSINHNGLCIFRLFCFDYDFSAYGNLTVRSLLDTIEHYLKEFDFPDPYLEVCANARVFLPTDHYEKHMLGTSTHLYLKL